MYFKTLSKSLKTMQKRNSEPELLSWKCGVQELGRVFVKNIK